MSPLKAAEEARAANEKDPERCALHATSLRFLLPPRVPLPDDELHSYRLRPVNRVRDSLGDSTEGTDGWNWSSPDEHEDRALAECPACRGPEALVFRSWAKDEDENTFLARCMAGCLPEALAAEIATLVPKHERLVAEAVREEARRQALAACSIRKTREAPPTEFLIPGAVPARWVPLKLGDTGARKTFDAIHKGLCIASGIAWYGRPVKRGVAMLVLLEGGNDQIARYMESIARGIGADLQALEEESMLLRYPDALKVDDDESWGAFVTMVELLQPTWICIDNLSRCRAKTTGGAANDNAVIGAIMERIERLSHDRGIAIELLHHVNSRGESLGARATPQNVDVEFRMRAASVANDALVTMELGEKNRAGTAALTKIQFHYIDRADGAIVPTEVRPKERGAGGEEAEEDPRREAMRKALLEEPLNTRGMMAALRWSFRKVSAVRDAMEAHGEIEQINGLWCLVGVED